jgi:hypothetical protein
MDKMKKSLDNVTPSEWDYAHRAMYKQTELTFEEHEKARALGVQVGVATTRT